MVMNRINGFGNLSRELIDRFQGSRRANAKETRDPPDSAPVEKGSVNGSSDTADISPKAHRLIGLRNAVDAGMKAMDAVPEVRQDRIAEARARLNRGFYNSIEVRTRIAERLEDVARNMEDV